MLGSSHQLVSISAVLSTEMLLQQPQQVNLWVTGGLVMGTAVGALAPDIDSPSSKGSKIIRVPLYKYLRHRGMTHSLLAWGLFTGLTYLLMALFMDMSLIFDPMTHFVFNIWIGLVAGYGLHLVEDSFSLDGIRWLAPFSKYDEVLYAHYKTKARVPVKFKDKRPQRHKWGMGYRVGGLMEHWIVILALIPLTIAIFVWVKRAWLLGETVLDFTL